MAMSATQSRMEPAWGPVLAVMTLVMVAGSWPLYSALWVGLRARISSAENGHQRAALPAGSVTVPSIRDEQLEASVEVAEPAQAQPVELHSVTQAGIALEQAGLAPEQARKWTRRLEEIAHVTSFAPGHRFIIYRDPDEGQIRGLRYDLDPHATVMERALGEEVVVATLRPIEYVTHSKAIALKVGRGFSTAAVKQGLSPTLINTVREAFKHEYPIEESHQNAILKVLYTYQVSTDGFYRTEEEFRAAQLMAEDKQCLILGFKEPSGRLRFFDQNGKDVGPIFLRYPLHFKFISSGFSYGRYHPILHRYRPHLGVDFVARYGTPVMAIGDGEVESAQWDSELGRCVRIRHENGLETVYGHLASISAGVKPGAKVRVGQVIGKVGSSGLSTGPHLHFSLIKNGRYVDPMAAHLGERAQVPVERWSEFRQMALRYLKELERVDKPYQQVTFNDAFFEKRSPHALPHVLGTKVTGTSSRVSTGGKTTRQVPTARGQSELDSSELLVSVEPAS